MIRRARHLSSRGSIVLVALCVIAVMGIGLAAHLSVSNQATRLANRNFQTGLSKQLAEMGLERALWAFNRNDWTGWSISGTTATRTINFPANKFGSTGATTAIKIRVDNYNAFHLDAMWDNNTRYRKDDFVLRNGQWYRATTGVNNNNRDPAVAANIPAFWAVATDVQEPTWNTGAYNIGDIVKRSGVYYRCIRAHTNQRPPNATYWSTAPLRSQAWTPGGYNLNDIVQRDGVWYRCISAHANSQPPPNTNYWAGAATWSAAENFAGVPPDAAYWEGARLPPSNTWSSTSTYVIDDHVVHQNVWYRCISGHTNQEPPNGTFWAGAGQLPSGAWNPKANYAVGNHVTHGGVWYRCIQAHSNRVPFDATYWTTTAPVIYAEGTVSLPDGSSPLRTQLRTLVAPAPLFPNAAAATETVTFSSGGIVDSYDSSRGDYNTTSNTPYPYSISAPNSGWSAVVAGGKADATAVTLTSPTVNGYVAAPSAPTAPYAPRVSFGGSAKVRGKDSPNTPNVDLTRVSRSPFIPQPDIITPNTGASDPLPNSNGTHTLGNPNDTASRVYVFNGNLSITDNNRLYIIDGPVRIVVTGQFYLGLNGGTSPGMRINNHATAKLEMFVGGDLAIYKNGIDNQTKLPERVAIYGTTTATAPDISTATAFHGVLYMPNGRFNVLGANRTVFGALSAKNLVFGGVTNLRYDTTLRHTTFSGVEPSYLLTEWRELTDTAERITF